MAFFRALFSFTKPPAPSPEQAEAPQEAEAGSALPNARDGLPRQPSISAPATIRHSPSAAVDGQSASLTPPPNGSLRHRHTITGPDGAGPVPDSQRQRVRSPLVEQIEADPRLSHVRQHQKALMVKLRKYKEVLAELNQRELQLLTLRPIPCGPRPLQPWELVFDFRFVSNEDLAAGKLDDAALEHVASECLRYGDLICDKIVKAQEETRRLDALIRSLRSRIRMMQSLVEAGNSIPEYTEHVRSLSLPTSRQSGERAFAAAEACTESLCEGPSCLATVRTDPQLYANSHVASPASATAAAAVGESEVTTITLGDASVVMISNASVPPAGSHSVPDLVPVA